MIMQTTKRHLFIIIIIIIIQFPPLNITATYYNTI